ncbi:hypothetical protein GCM10027572_35730 [Flexivirga lutea]
MLLVKHLAELASSERTGATNETHRGLTNKERGIGKRDGVKHPVLVNPHSGSRRAGGRGLAQRAWNTGT